MASLFDLNSGSSDSEDDADYVPANESESDLSDVEYCGDEIDYSDLPEPKRLKRDEKVSESAVNNSGSDVWKNFLDSVKSTPYGKSTQASTSIENENKKSVVTEDNCVKVTKDNPAKIAEDNPVKVAEDNPVIVAEDNPVKGAEDNSVKVAVDNPVKVAADNLVKVAEDNPVKVTDDKTLLENNAADKVDSVSNGAGDKIVQKPSVNEPVKRKPVDVSIFRPRSGVLAPFLSNLNKGKKQSVLEKSLSDWEQYKKEEGIEKDLETFNKGRDGFIERQRFLQRSDFRSFENERNIRKASRK